MIYRGEEAFLWRLLSCLSSFVWPSGLYQLSWSSLTLLCQNMSHCLSLIWKRRFCCDSESIQKIGGIGENRGSVKRERPCVRGVGGRLKAGRCARAPRPAGRDGLGQCGTTVQYAAPLYNRRHHCTICGTSVQYAAPVYNMHLSCPQASLHSAASAEHTEFAIRPLRRLDFDLLVVSRCRLYYAESLVFVIFSGQFVLTQRWGRLRPQQLFTR